MAITDGLKEGTTLKDVLDATYSDMSAEFKTRIAPTFGDDELVDFGNALVDYKAGANEFLYSLINRIGMVNVNYQSFQSPLSVFKKGFMEYGDTIEDIYIEPVKALLYEPEVPNTNPGDQWATFKPDIDVVYHKVNRELVYPLSINDKILRRAFTSYRELDKFLSGLMLQLYNADEIDDFALTMQLLESVDDWFYKVHVDAVTNETTAKNLVIAVRSVVPTLRFPARKFNAKGVLNWNSADEMYLLVTPQINAILDVEVLAKAFNMDRAKFMGHVVEVPELWGNAQAVLVHREFLQIWDTMRQMATTGVNALHLTQNYFYHHHGIMSASPYYPAIEFTTDTIDDTGLTVVVAPVGTLPQAITAGTYSFAATVTGTNSHFPSSNAVIWKVTDGKGNVPQYVSINQNGTLTVGKNYNGGALTIEAVSTADEKATADYQFGA